MSWYKINQRKNNFAGRYIFHEELHKIIARAVEAEREACAMTCENRLYQTWQECAGAIRARG